MTGRIKLHRSSQENELYFLEPFTRWQAWQDMVLIANHTDGKIIVRGNVIELKRGQLGHSEDTLAKRWKWSRNKVRRYLNYLETIQQIEQQKSKVKSTITIKNYDKYQSNDTTDDTTERLQTIQQTDTNKNDNKEKNEKEGKEIISKDTAIAEYGDPNINKLQKFIEQVCLENNILYSGKGKTERNALKWLLSKKMEDKLKTLNMKLSDLIRTVIPISTQIKYGKTLSSGYLIYYHREEIYNKAQKENVTNRSGVSKF